MHILFLTDNFPPEVNAPASRTFEHCVEWVKNENCEVTVITCAPNFPHGTVFKGYRNKLFQEERISGIRVIRVWSFIAPNNGFLLRILDYLSFMLMSFLVSFFVRRIDLVVGTSPQFFTACSAFAVSFTRGLPWVFELRDIWPESIKVVGAMRDSLVIRFLERLELFLYRKATKIIAVTNTFRTDLIARGIDGEKIAVVTNGVDLSRFKPSNKDEKLVFDLNLQDKIIAGYIGTHGMAHGLDVVLEAAKLASDKPEFSKIHFLLLGDGADKGRLIKLAEANDLENVSFIGSVSKEEVVRYWSVLDVAIVHLRKDPLFESVIPSKIFECMGMGIPILHGVEGESMQIIHTTGSGIGFEPENPTSLLSSLKDLLSDEGKLEEIKMAALVASNAYDRKVLAMKMYEILCATENDTQ